MLKSTGGSGRGVTAKVCFDSSRECTEQQILAAMCLHCMD